MVWPQLWLEFGVDKYIRQWGVSANYTYTNSSDHSAKENTAEVASRRWSTTIVNSLVDQKRPLQGQSIIIANVSFLYKNQDRFLMRSSRPWCV